MSKIRICKYCGMELSEGIPHGLRECHLRAVARIAELEESDKHWAGNVKVCMQLIERYESDIAELEGERRWIPVSERLPEEYVKVIAFAKDCMNVDWVLPEDLREVGKGAFARLYNVTHWMPLPSIPESEDK